MLLGGTCQRIRQLLSVLAQRTHTTRLFDPARPTLAGLDIERTGTIPRTAVDLPNVLRDRGTILRG